MLSKTPILAALAFAGVATTLSAQVTTPAQFKAACENSPLNTISINVPVKVSAAVPGTPATVINTGCRLVFGPNGKFEADLVSFAFAGPLTFAGTANTEIVLAKSLITAPSIQVSGGTASALKINESTLATTSGSLGMNFGADAVLEAALPYAGRTSVIESAGAIQIAGGRKFAATFSDAGVRAETGLSIAISGVEGKVTAVNAPIATESGALSITSSAASAVYDLTSGSLTSGAGIVLSARGANAQINLAQMVIDSGSGSVTVESSTGTASFGVLKLADVTMTSGGSVTITASRTARKGEAVVEVSNITAQGSIRVESGIEGVTTVLNNGLTSPSLILAATAPSGSCVAENNTAVAPTLRLCQ